MHQSIATISSPEFINLQPTELNPLMSKCEIKVLYVGKNRNRSYITKEVATEMAKTLRGAPIVGYYREDKKDFSDHGEVIYLDEDGIHFECKTTPFGFVSPDAEVWFKEFEDYDDFGNPTLREYLMTTGYLWTGQFPECAEVLTNSGKPQSMELEEESMNGKWSKDNQSGMDFYIINDAIFSKLCILGEDVEPCFEGANITAPVVSTEYTMDSTFKHTLFSMVEDLKNVLQGGKQQMNEFEEKVTPEEEVEVTFKKEDEEEEKKNAPAEDDTDSEEEKEEDVDSEEKEDEDEKKKNLAKSSLNEELEELKQNYTLLQNDFNALCEKNKTLEAECVELRAFKLQVENEQKDALINKFYMLSEEDKKEVIENKAKYSLDEIEAKLSVIYCRKGVNFDLDEDSKNEDSVGAKEQEAPVVTFNLDNNDSAVPAWIQALKDARSKNN